MTTHDLTDSLYLATEEQFNDGDIIYEEAASGDWVYVVISGEVEIFKVIRGKKVVVDVLKKGDLFGEVSFVDKLPRSAGARAVGKVTLGFFDRQFLTEEYNKLPSDFRAIFDTMARRLRKMTAVATNLAGRKSQRVVENIEVKFKTAEEFLKAYSHNISSGGLFIHSEKVLEVGREVKLQFNLPGDDKPVVTNGRVVWAKTEPKGMGIEFMGLDPKDEERIENFVDRKLAGAEPKSA